MGMDFKNVLVFGVENTVLRKKIERYLGNEYKIIGYSDLVYDADIIQGRFFIDKSRINDFNIYAVVLCSTDKDEISLMTECIREAGFIGRVIDPKILYYRNCVYVPDLVYELTENNFFENYTHIDGVVLGMSYSFFGIDEKRLNGDWVNLSYRGTDLYYNCKLCNLVMDQCEKVEKILLVMPYYYFEYDMSQLPFEYSSGQIFAVRRLGWHNAEKSFGNETIKNYVICDELFGDRFFSENRGEKFFYNKDKKETFFSGVLSHLWKNIDVTIENENKRLFADFMKQLQDDNIDITIIIPPLYTDCLSPQDKEVIEEMRRHFYYILNELNIYRVFDYFSSYNDVDLFWDFEHLNYYGKEKFTALVNSDICM